MFIGATVFAIQVQHKEPRHKKAKSWHHPEGLQCVGELSKGVLVLADLGVNPCLAIDYSGTAWGKSLHSLHSLGRII